MFVFADGDFDTGIVASPFRVCEFDETVEFPLVTKRGVRGG